MSYNPHNPNGQATSANSSPVVIASDQSAVPVSGSVTLGANQSVNVNQVAGTAVDVNSGLKSAGTQRVVIATDQPQLTSALKVDGSATTQPISGTVTVQQTTAANLKVDLSGTAANATALKVDGSAVTQPVSGTVTANMGTTNGLALDTTLTGGSQKTKLIDTGGTNVATISAAGALKVDGSAATQPVSGTVTSNIGTTNGLALDTSVTGQQVSQGSATSGQKGNLVQGAVTTSAPTYTTAQTSPLSLTTAGALRVDSSASTQPISGTVSIAANQSVNVNQVAGTTTDTNSGAKSAGTLRVVLATDQPQLTSALKVDGSAVTQPVSGTITSNAGTGTFTVNNSQVGGSTISTGNGVSGTGVQRVTIASDSTGQVALATGANTIGNVGINAGSNTIGAVNILPSTTGGWSVNSQTALTNTKIAVKASAGTFGGYMIYNPNASVEYVQVFDVASGSVTLGTTAPTYVIPIPAAAAANVEFTLGVNHATAITLAATTTATGSSAPASSLTGFFLFK